MKVNVRWEVTEVHEAEIEVDHDFEADPEGVDMDTAVLAAHEDGTSYVSTPDRAVLEIVEVRDE